jgi:ANTAR domain
MDSAAGESAWAYAGMLDRAEGVLVGLRGCTVDEAFDEILGAAKRHRVPTLDVARGLVALAQHANDGDPDGMAVARFEWGSLMERTAVSR